MHLLTECIKNFITLIQDGATVDDTPVEKSGRKGDRDIPGREKYSRLWSEPTRIMVSFAHIGLPEQNPIVHSNFDLYSSD